MVSLRHGGAFRQIAINQDAPEMKPAFRDVFSADLNALVVVTGPRELLFAIPITTPFPSILHNALRVRYLVCHVPSMRAL